MRMVCLNNKMCCIIVTTMETSIKEALASLQKKTVHNDNLTPAAVIVPIFRRCNDYHLLFILRSDHVAHHKGQISFPGGMRSEEDSSLLDTALRETWEEIGLEPSDAEVVGELDDKETTTGFLVSPFVAFIPYPYKFVPSPLEIAEIFDVPVSALLDGTNFKQTGNIIGGELSNTDFHYEYNGRIIWGATASILKQLLDVLGTISGNRDR